MFWYKRIISDESKFSENIQEACLFYENELENAKKELEIEGDIEKILKDLPILISFRFAQLQDLEAILENLNNKLVKIRGEKTRNFLENYNRSLSLKEVERYVESDRDYINFKELVNYVAFIRNLYLGLIKGLENKSFQLNNIVKLRTAGMEDIIL